MEGFGAAHSDDKEQKMFCGRCGTQIPVNGTFCPKCGSRLNVNTGAAPRNTGYMNNNAPKPGNPGHANRGAAPRNTGYMNNGAPMPRATGYMSTDMAAPRNTGYMNNNAPMPGNPGHANRGAATRSTGYTHNGATAPRTTGYMNAGMAAPRPANTGYIVPVRQNQQNRPAPAAAPKKTAKGKRKAKKSRVPTVICSTLLITAIVVTMVLFVGPIGKPYLKPIDDLFTGFNNQDYALMMDSVAPELNGVISVDDLVGDFDPGLRFSYQVLQEERIKKTDPTYLLLRTFGVKNCYKVTTHITASYYGETEDLDELTFYVGKFKGKWRIVYVEGLLEMI